VRVPSSDQVSVAVHEFGGAGRPLLLSHATGFHAYCYLPIADELGDRATSFALDYRGHGDTARPDDWAVDWEGYGDDAVAVARAIAPDGGLIAFGHSMGGACLLMAAHRQPDLFDHLVVYEPIVFPPRDPDADAAPGPSLSEGARRRRATFPSFDAAIANYSSKPPMMAFDPDVVRLYVAHGFRPSPEGVRLKCDPEHEARTFDNGGNHATWAVLPDIRTPVTVMAGNADAGGPGMIAGPVAEQLPNARLVQRDDWNHFTPFVDPGAMAAEIRSVLEP
jgi:pimeloyl-ACP methyl ester carboxylesterase